MQVINGLGVLVLAANNGVVYYFHFIRSTKGIEIDLELIGQFSLGSDDTPPRSLLTLEASTKSDQAQAVQQIYSSKKATSAQSYNFFEDMLQHDSEEQDGATLKPD